MPTVLDGAQLSGLSHAFLLHFFAWVFIILWFTCFMLLLATTLLTSTPARVRGTWSIVDGVVRSTWDVVTF